MRLPYMVKLHLYVRLTFSHQILNIFCVTSTLSGESTGHWWTLIMHVYLKRLYAEYLKYHHNQTYVNDM